MRLMVLTKAKKGEQRPGHKYTRRWWDQRKRSWVYEYGDGAREHRGEQADPRALHWLRHATVHDNRVTLPEMPRAEYEKVNEILERVGGKWNTRARAHLFGYDPSHILHSIQESGEMPPKNPTAFFPTPKSLVDQMIQVADLDYMNDPDTKILEPSAGHGAIADAIRAKVPQAQLDVVELLPMNADALARKGHAVHEQDFLSFKGGPYDRIIMNPPFSVDGDALAYITHINHAWDMLKDGGKLVAIVPTGFTFRNDEKSRAFRKLVDMHGWREEVPAGTFKESGTGIPTMLVELTKTDQSWREQPYNGYKNWYTWALGLHADNEHSDYDWRARLAERTRAGRENDPRGKLIDHYKQIAERARKMGEPIDDDHVDFESFVRDWEEEHDVQVPLLVSQEVKAGAKQRTAAKPAKAAAKPKPEPKRRSEEAQQMLLLSRWGHDSVLLQKGLYKGAGMVKLDADLFNADWTKASWDLGVETPEQLTRALRARGMTLEQFFRLPVAQRGAQRLPWLANLAVGYHQQKSRRAASVPQQPRLVVRRGRR